MQETATNNSHNLMKMQKNIRYYSKYLIEDL